MSVSVSVSVSSAISVIYTLHSGERTNAERICVFVCMNCSMRAQALIASNWIAIDRELAYFSFVFADTASVDLELEIYPLVQGELGQRWGCELVNWQTGKVAKWVGKESWSSGGDNIVWWRFTQLLWFVSTTPANNDIAFHPIHLLIHGPISIIWLVMAPMIWMSNCRGFNNWGDNWFIMTVNLFGQLCGEYASKSMPDWSSVVDELFV